MLSNIRGNCIGMIKHTFFCAFFICWHPVATSFPHNTQHGLRPQTSPFTYGSSVSSAQYSSQQSLNSVFEREDPNSYNSIISRQLMRSAADPTYASINESAVGNANRGTMNILLHVFSSFSCIGMPL